MFLLPKGELDGHHAYFNCRGGMAYHGYQGRSPWLGLAQRYASKIQSEGLCKIALNEGVA